MPEIDPFCIGLVTGLLTGGLIGLFLGVGLTDREWRKRQDTMEICAAHLRRKEQR